MHFKFLLKVPRVCCHFGINLEFPKEHFGLKTSQTDKQPTQKLNFFLIESSWQ